MYGWRTYEYDPKKFSNYEQRNSVSEEWEQEALAYLVHRH